MTTSLSLPQIKHSTPIEWTHVPGYKGETLNPIRARNKRTGAVGHWCKKISPGCLNCYAETWNLKNRFKHGAGAPYTEAGRDEVEIFLDEDRLTQPLRWAAPRAIFWVDMTDMFGDWVPFDWIDKIMAVCARTPQHIHMFLTKRPKRMKEYFDSKASPLDRSRADIVSELAQWIAGDKDRIIWDARGSVASNYPRGMTKAEAGMRRVWPGWPLPNVWLGTSAENQKFYDERIADLTNCPARVRFLSLEPLIGPIDLGLGAKGDMRCRAPYIDWAIIGGESGNDPRPQSIQWDLSIIRQCAAAGVACFMKQLGGVPVDAPVDVKRLSAVSMSRTGLPITHAIRDDGKGADAYERIKLKSRKGGDMGEWPAEFPELRVRQFPAPRGK